MIKQSNLLFIEAKAIQIYLAWLSDFGVDSVRRIVRETEQLKFREIDFTQTLDKRIIIKYSECNKIFTKKTINSPIPKSIRVLLSTFCNM